jgi:hypothetical protein
MLPSKESKNSSFGVFVAAGFNSADFEIDDADRNSNRRNQKRELSLEVSIFAQSDGLGISPR